MLSPIQSQRVERLEAQLASYMARERVLEGDVRSLLAYTERLQRALAATQSLVPPMPALGSVTPAGSSGLGVGVGGIPPQQQQNSITSSSLAPPPPLQYTGAGIRPNSSTPSSNSSFAPNSSQPGNLNVSMSLSLGLGLGAKRRRQSVSTIASASGEVDSGYTVGGGGAGGGEYAASEYGNSAKHASGAYMVSVFSFEESRYYLLSTSSLYRFL